MATLGEVLNLDPQARLIAEEILREERSQPFFERLRQQPILATPRFLVQEALNRVGDVDVQLGLKTPEQARQRAEFLSSFVPHTATDFAVTAALGPGGKLAQLTFASPVIRRLATGGLATGAGALASTLEGGSPLPGALQGAVGGVAGVVPAVGGYLVRATPAAQNRILARMVGEVFEEMSKVSPAFRQIKPTQAYEQIVVFPSMLQREFNRQFRAGLARASELAPGPVVDSPRLLDIWERLPKKGFDAQALRQSLAPTDGKFTVEQAQELLQIARRGAFRGEKLLTEKASSELAQKTYQAARREVYESLPKEAAETLEQTRIMHGINLGLAKIFREGQALKPSPGGPRLDPNAALSYMEKAGDKLRSRLGNDVYEALRGIFGRGGKLGERHQLETQRFFPGLLERNIVLARFLLEQFGLSPVKFAGRAPQPFTSPSLEALTGIVGSQAVSQLQQP